MRNPTIDDRPWLMVARRLIMFEKSKLGKIKLLNSLFSNKKKGTDRIIGDGPWSIAHGRF
jgi:hypothetical protein